MVDFMRRLSIGNPSGAGKPCKNDDGSDFAMSLNRILIASRIKQGGTSIGDFCSDDIEACDFARNADALLRKREYDHENAATQGRGTYYCADAFRQDGETVYAYHNWGVSYPIATAVNKVFDTFLLWAWIYHAGETVENIEPRLSFVMICEGNCPAFRRHPTQKWLQQFYDVYAPWFEGCFLDGKNAPLLYGLACYRDVLGFYRDISTSAGSGCISK